MNVLFALYFSSLLPYPIIAKYVIIWNMTHTIVNAESCGYDRQVPSIQILQILEVRFRLIGELISIYCLCCSIFFKQHFSNFGLCEKSLRRCLKIQTFNLRNWESKKIESQRDVVTLFFSFFFFFTCPWRNCMTFLDPGKYLSVPERNEESFF